jgi:nucleotide-binding universal stress UspA family protein
MGCWQYLIPIFAVFDFLQFLQSSRSNIVCPTDFSEPAHEGLKIARELTTQFSSEILLVHVVTPLPAMHGGAAPTGFHIPPVLKELEGSAKSSLEEIRREKLPAEIQARMIVIHGKPAHEIVSLASQENADIIVIATQGESGWQRFVFGSLVRRKLRRISDVNSNGRGTCQWAEFETTAEAIAAGLGPPGVRGAIANEAHVDSTIKI